MEAETITKKKSISKGKIKKSLRNVLCRPDPVFWPNVSETHAKLLESALEIHRIEIPVFKKPQWKEIKSIPKDQRPKAGKLPKVEGLLFCRTEVTTAIQNKNCSVVLIESSVNPRTIVLPLIEQCVKAKVATLCLNGLRTLSGQYFGIATACLGVECDHLQDITDVITEIAKNYKPPTKKEDIKPMDVDENSDKNENVNVIPTEYKLLYRTSKRTRVFNPSQYEPISKKSFAGQDFIEFSNKPVQKTDSKAYMNMILKKISNNQNKIKRK